MDYIIYINSLIDHVKYRSYGDVQQAMNRGEIFPDPPEYRPKHICKYCGKEVIKTNPWDSSEFCNASCAGKYAYREKHGDRASKCRKEFYFVVRSKKSGPKTQKYHERIVAIVPYYNEGLSDSQIGRKLGLSDKYIANIRHMFSVPANYGQPPSEKIDVSKI
jgi:hypothetical protein